MFKYDPKSHMADEFINNKEIEETLFYAEKNKNNLKLIDSILEKVNMHTENGKSGTIMLNHRETLVLLLCEDKQRVNKIFDIAAKIKQAYYGKRIVLFAPLYLSNYCINDCLYCPYHIRNKKIPRKKLTQEEVQKEVVALLNMGHKRLAIEAGEDPVNNSMEYILECIETIYNTWYKNGNIRRVNVNIAATSHKNYDRLKQAKIGTYILFQETYNKEKYINLHPSGPKSDYNYHTQAMDRAIESGINDIGLGVLFGLNDYKYDLAGLIMHAEHLEAVYEIGPHTISVPRIKKADGINPNKFNNGIDDKTFEKIIACIRLSLPYTGIIISTRESQQIREKVLNLGVTQISAASRTSVGGYTQNKRPTDTEQFDVSDQRTLDEIILCLIKNKYIPSFCTACYRELRTGQNFMNLCKKQQISKFCHPNALITLSEYLIDYASDATKNIGWELIQSELNKIKEEKIREICRQNIEKIKNSNFRDFRF